jgi:hypothetical protein
LHPFKNNFPQLHLLPVMLRRTLGVTDNLKKMGGSGLGRLGPLGYLDKKVGARSERPRKVATGKKASLIASDWPATSCTQKCSMFAARHGMCYKPLNVRDETEIHTPSATHLLVGCSCYEFLTIFERHFEEPTNNGIQPRARYRERRRRREAHRSIHILRCSYLSVQRPWMAGQAPCAMDPLGNDNRRPARQLRPKRRTSTTTGHIRWCINTYRYVSISSFSLAYG